MVSDPISMQGRPGQSFLMRRACECLPIWKGLFALLLFTACSSDPTGVEDPSPVEGHWQYDALQTLPDARNTEGTVAWFSIAEGGTFYEGTYHMVEELPEGGHRSYSGTGSGSILADTIADFDLSIEGVRRRHIGIFRGDSIAGGWVDLQGGGASGNFVLRRAP